MAIGLGGDIWIYDIERGTRTRLTSEGGGHPVWTSDGTRIAFNRVTDLFWQPADGSGDAELLWAKESESVGVSWSPDGLLAFEERTPSGSGIWVLNVAEREAKPFLDTSFNECSPVFSPDGRWVAYVSDESGRKEVYVRTYPGLGERWAISTAGGTEPLWSADGKELFYRNGDQVLSVSVQTEPAFSAGKPKLLFDGWYQTDPVGHPFYDVSRDGERFLMLAPDRESAMTQIHVVLNWGEELRRLAPVED